MARGSPKSPRNSGPEYFGITLQQLVERESIWYLEDESEGQVDPVFVDADGRRFLKFLGRREGEPSGSTSRSMAIGWKATYSEIEDKGGHKMDRQHVDNLLEAAERGIQQFLDVAKHRGQIDLQSYEQATRNVVPSCAAGCTMTSWTGFLRGLRRGSVQPSREQWEDLVECLSLKRSALALAVARAMMAFDRESIKELKTDGIGAPILEGPNTINDLVLLKARLLALPSTERRAMPPYEGCDWLRQPHSGFYFAKLIAELFLNFGYTVYFFDEPCPYPEMTFAIPHASIKGDIGILISASHNDYRYNGYKLSCGNGSQFDPNQRNDMYLNYIATAKTHDIRLLPFDKAPTESLVFSAVISPFRASSISAGKTESWISTRSMRTT